MLLVPPPPQDLTLTLGEQGHTQTGLAIHFLFHATMHPASQPGTSKKFLRLSHTFPFLLHLVE